MKGGPGRLSTRPIYCHYDGERKLTSEVSPGKHLLPISLDILDAKWCGKPPNHFGQYILYLKSVWIPDVTPASQACPNLFSVSINTISPIFTSALLAFLNSNLTINRVLSCKAGTPCLIYPTVYLGLHHARRWWLAGAVEVPPKQVGNTCVALG